MSDEQTPAWHVLGPGREETQLSDTGPGWSQVFVVPFAITTGPAKGQHFSVRVPPEDYTPDAIRRHIEGWVQVHHNVASVRSDNA